MAQEEQLDDEVVVDEVAPEVEPQAEGVPVDPDTPEPEQAEAAPEVAEQPEPAEEPEYIQATPDEARERNYVPYETRFKPVIDERNQLRAQLEERERLLAYYQQGQHQQAPQPAVTPDMDAYGEPDPEQLAVQTHQELQELKARMATQEQARAINERITQAANELGFRDPQKAAESIRKEIVANIRQDGSVPDVAAVAHALRHEERKFAESIISDYVKTKRSPEARAAAPTPASPPVVEAPSRERLGGIGTRKALDAIMSKLTGG